MLTLGRLVRFFSNPLSNVLYLLGSMLEKPARLKPKIEQHPQAGTMPHLRRRLWSNVPHLLKATPPCALPRHMQKRKQQIGNDPDFPSMETLVLPVRPNATNMGARHRNPL